MEVKSFLNPSPHLLLENVFTDDQLTQIWTELDFLHPTLLPGSETGSAKSDDGVDLKRNAGRYIYQTYADPSISHIRNHLTTVAFKSGLADHLPHSWLKASYNETNWDTIMLSYYKDGDYYKPHVDTAVFTLLVWLWKEPKQFSGGNLHFTESDTLIECKNNCGILFMSGERHHVDELKLDQEGFGRYCLTSFSGIK